jgi:hypothetical protein
MLSGGAERYLVRAETSSLDAVSAALHAETAEVAAGRNLRRHSHSYSHSRRRTRRPALVFGRAWWSGIFLVEKRQLHESSCGLDRRRSEFRSRRTAACWA